MPGAIEVGQKPKPWSNMFYSENSGTFNLLHGRGQLPLFAYIFAMLIINIHACTLFNSNKSQQSFDTSIVSYFFDLVSSTQKKHRPKFKRKTFETLPQNIFSTIFGSHVTLDSTDQVPAWQYKGRLGSLSTVPSSKVYLANTSLLFCSRFKALGFQGKLMFGYLWVFPPTPLEKNQTIWSVG